MSQPRILGAAVLLFATMATPALAQYGVLGPGSRDGLEPEPGPTYYRSYGAFDAPYVSAPRQYDYRYSGRDRSRGGGYSPSRLPPN